MLKRIFSFVVLLMMISLGTQAQVFKVKIIDQPKSDIYDLVMSYEGGDFYRFTMIGSKVIFNVVFEILSDTKNSNDVVVQNYRSRTRVVLNTNDGYLYPDYATLMIKAYDEDMYRVIHFNFSFIKEEGNRIKIDDLNLVCRK